MGCIHSKIGSEDDFGPRKPITKESSTSTKKEGGVDDVGNDTPKNSVSRDQGDEGEKKITVFEKPNVPSPIYSVFTVQNGVDGAQVVAGWPSWLTSAAGEAIKGWIPRKADSFQKLDKIGQGTYSTVYRARDLEKGKMVALKKVRFANMDPQSVRFMAREILVLRRLDHPNVMKLEGLVTSRVSGSFYLIFEYMEHDLAGLAASPDIKFTEPQIKCFMKQLLCGLEHCHNRGVLHRDIKASNLLIDDKGNLKIGDLGLATFYNPNQKQVMTSRVVTLWYRPPELLLGSTSYGVGVDLWSSGCILAELFAGKPVMLGRTEVEQLHKIYKLCGSPPEDYWKNSELPCATMFKPKQSYKRTLAETYKDFPKSALTLLDSLLAFEPESRGSTTSALESEFFTSAPLPCDPSSLPKYPPSKEYDAKLRNYERSKRAKDGNDEKKSNANAAPNDNPALPTSLQKCPERVKENRNSNPEQYNREPDRFSISITEQPIQASLKRLNQYGGSTHVPNVTSQIDYSRFSVDLRPQRFLKHNARLSKFSSSVAEDNVSRFDPSREGTRHKHWRRESPLVTSPSFLSRLKDSFFQREEDEAARLGPEETQIVSHHQTTKKGSKHKRKKFKNLSAKLGFSKTKKKQKEKENKTNMTPSRSFTIYN